MNKEYLKSLPVIGKILHIVHGQLVQINVARKRFPVYRRETKKALCYIEGLEKNPKRIFFCAVPIHNNLGDQAQAYCIRKWLLEHYPDYEICEFAAWPFYNKKFCSIFEKTVCKENIFVIQSGYCTYEGHYNHKVHRYIADTFIANRILIMPQTVNFRKEREGFKTGTIYDRHPRLLFLARDKKSDEYARHFFPKTKIELFPDIVTSLIGTMKLNTERNGVVICVRNDGEKLYTDHQIDDLKRKFLALKIDAKIVDTDYPENVKNFASEFERCFFEKLQELASAKVVITDRYHGTIFSMITNTPVIVLATRDHKVKTGTEWFGDIYSGSYFNADSIEEAFIYANNLLQNKVEINNNPYFKEVYYDKLPEMFNRL